MKKLIKLQTGNSKVVLVILVVVLLLAALYYFLNQRSTNVGNLYQPPTVGSSIQNDQGLMSASADLDKTNLDALDKDLSQNDADAANF